MSLRTGFEFIVDSLIPLAILALCSAFAYVTSQLSASAVCYHASASTMDSSFGLFSWPQKGDRYRRGMLL